ncbi:MAG: hypothetical protein H6911_03795 [Rickettsiaceae bacterium]|nr:hypothetical protein [Rickettsiaceae bacterium]
MKKNPDHDPINNPFFLAFYLPAEKVKRTNGMHKKNRHLLMLNIQIPKPALITCNVMLWLHGKKANAS